MCKYKHPKDETPCNVEYYFFLYSNKISLPLDDSGYCIFHSKDIEWKMNNEFPKFCTMLFQIIEYIVENNIIMSLLPEYHFDIRGISWLSNSTSDKNEKIVLFPKLST
jgi:hypothetical protein